MPRIGRYGDGPLFRIVAAAVVLFGISAVALDPPLMIRSLNGLLLSVSGGVIVAYAPVFLGALSLRNPTKGDFLGCGVFLSFLAVFLMRMVSLAVRDFATPWILNSTIAAAPIAMSLVGGLLHLWAPNAVEGRLPRERWVQAGCFAATGILIAFAVWSVRSYVPTHPSIQLR